MKHAEVALLRRADATDLAQIEARFEAAGRLAPARGSIAARLADPHGGVLIGEGSCASWTVDSGALHIYDVLVYADSPPQMVEAIADAADGFAAANNCAVTGVTLREDDPLIRDFEACGFERDWNEQDVVHGEICILHGLIRPVGSALKGTLL